MKDNLPNWRDDKRDRERVEQWRKLIAEPIEVGRRRSTVRRIVAGIVLGSLGYLLWSCGDDYQLHQPKIERSKFNFDLRPMCFFCGGT